MTDNCVIENSWTTKAGLAASCVLANNGSHRNGYVAVPETHILYGCDYDTAIDILTETLTDGFVDVHGGITYSGSEVGKILNNGTWHFGFDCAHYGDEIRGLSMSRREGDVWRTQEYVEVECERLAATLASMPPSPMVL